MIGKLKTVQLVLFIDMDQKLVPNLPNHPTWQAKTFLVFKAIVTVFARVRLVYFQFSAVDHLVMDTVSELN